jgi:hypothetical protein
LRTGWILSHSTWRDEKSVVRWRTVGEHHAVQQRGRAEVLGDYHLRVGEVTADTAGALREQRFDATEIGAAKVSTLTEITPKTETSFPDGVNLAPGLGLESPDSCVVDHDVFASIYNPGKLALLVSWPDAEAAARWTPTTSVEVDALRHRVVLIVRDYGKFDRREASQFYPDAPGRETIHAQPAG